MPDYLSKIGELELLNKLYNQITTTHEVSVEFGHPLPEWIQIKSASNQYYQKILELQIDLGEASAIALALEQKHCVLIVDDYKARKIAVGLGIAITGTIGLIIKAKKIGVIPSIKPFIVKIQQTDFRMSQSLIEYALSLSGE